MPTIKPTRTKHSDKTRQELSRYFMRRSLIYLAFIIIATYFLFFY